jgi:hypothetical protein
MDILEKKYLNDFPPKIKSLFKNLRFKKEPLEVIGSSSFKRQKYFGDFDIKNYILKKYSPKQIYDEINKILSYILEKNNDIYFIELKLQKKNGDKIKYSIDDEFKFNDLEKFYKDLDFIKIDFIVFYENRFIEVSINYVFDTTITETKIIGELKKAIEEEAKDKNYLKAIKRYLSYLITENKEANYDKIEKIITFLNSDVGQKYKILSNLKAIELLKENYDDTLTMGKAKINLDDIRRITKDSPKKLENDIKNEAKKFFEYIYQ